MNTSHRRAGAAGFSLVELVVIIALAAILIFIAVPPLQRFVNRGRLEGATRETAMLMNQARMEAIRRGVPVVVYLDYDTDQVIAFADVNDGVGTLVSNLEYDPGPQSAQGGNDYEIRRLTLPATIAFWGSNDADPEGPDAVWGFTDIPVITPNAAVFEPDGSVRDRGAFGFADLHDNFLEVLVSPEATARVAVRMYNPDIPAGLDGSEYHEPGKHPVTGERTWVWH